MRLERARSPRAPAEVGIGLLCPRIPLLAQRSQPLRLTRVVIKELCIRLFKGSPVNCHGPSGTLGFTHVH